MRGKQLIRILLLGVSVWIMAGWFDCGGGPQQGNFMGGFPVISRDVLVGPGGPVTSFPHPGIAISGTWLADATNAAAGDVKFFSKVTDLEGNAFVAGGRIHANWSSQVRWEPPCGEMTSQTQNFFDVSPSQGIGWDCITIVTPAAAGLSTHFALPNALPATITAHGSGFTTTYGMPQLKAYANGALASQVTATSVATDGSSATFPFPKSGNGTVLPMGFYGIALSNSTSTGTRSWVAANYLAMGGNDTSFTTPYGVAAANVTTTTRFCPPPPCNPTCTALQTQAVTCTTDTSTASYPVVTQYSTNQLKYRGSLVSVGVHPTALALFGTSRTSTNDGDGTTVTVVQPAKAVVANTGSNSLSIVDLVARTNIATVLIGTTPVALEVKPDNSVVWVVNYGDGTLKEVNLATNAIARSLNIGSNPASIVYDSASNVLWVGGFNYLKKVNLTSFSVVDTISISGQVTSVGYSPAQGELVLTVVTGGVSFPYNSQAYFQSSSASIQEYKVSTKTRSAMYTDGGSADTYKNFSMIGTMPNVSIVPKGTVISANYSNSISVSTTPTGFTVLDLVNHAEIMKGNTPTPIRSIGVDPAQGITYLAVPDSNLVITVPLK